MTVTPAALGAHPINEPGQNPRIVPAYVSARVLAANTHEEITIPAKSAYVRLAATADIYYSFAGNAAVPTDLDDGSACELVKQQGGAEWLMIPPGSSDGTKTLSVISEGTPKVTASFYTV